MSFREMKENLVEDYDGWIVDADGFFVCPCGIRIEDDGQCPEGHVSPMRQERMI